VAKVVAFLSSDESSFMNGSEVFVDDGDRPV
jgi:enoyl-[acyl-carrier-protein] reductase (NADH)